jgi:predicted peptidase
MHLLIPGLGAGILALIGSTAMGGSPLPLAKKTFTDAKGEVLPYRLLEPKPIAAGKKYPLVLFLHGAGERGADNERQLIHGVPEFASPANRRKYPCFLIAPQCPEKEMWVNLPWTVISVTQPKKPSPAMRLVFELLDMVIKELPIDRDRIYITGLSMGGFGAWDAICRRPDFFAAAVPICGGGDPAQAAKIASLPIWVFHGARDEAVRPELSRTMVAALKKAGGHPKYTECPMEGHASWVPAYRDPEMMRWLFVQKRREGKGEP